MKRLETQIKKKNKTKTIYVIVDNKTAEVLEKVSIEIKHEYIIGEHELYLSDLRETRRHQSFELLFEKGHEFIDEQSSLEDMLVNKDRYNNLYKAINNLSDSQKWLLREIYFKGRSNMDVARQLGVTEGSIRHRLEKIYNKLKKSCI